MVDKCNPLELHIPGVGVGVKFGNWTILLQMHQIIEISLLVRKK